MEVASPSLPGPPPGLSEYLSSRFFPFRQSLGPGPANPRRENCLAGSGDRTVSNQKYDCPDDRSRDDRRVWTAKQRGADPPEQDPQ